MLVLDVLQTAKGAKTYNAAMAATAEGQQTTKGDEKIKPQTHSYCCLDYAQVLFFFSFDSFVDRIISFAECSAGFCTFLFFF